MGRPHVRIFLHSLGYGEPAFWEGYGKGPAQGRNAEIRCAVYTLHNLLLNTYVYFKEYNDAANGVRERANVYKPWGTSAA